MEDEKNRIKVERDKLEKEKTRLSQDREKLEKEIRKLRAIPKNKIKVKKPSKH